MKKTFALLLVLALMLPALALAAPAVDLSTYDDAQLAQLIADALKEQATRKINNTEYLATTEIAGLFIGIQSMEKAADMTGKDAVSIVYDVLNKSDIAVSPIMGYNIAVSQAGQQLERTYVISTEGIQVGSPLSDLQPGSLVTLDEAYALTGDAPVSLSITSLFAMDATPFVFEHQVK